MTVILATRQKSAQLVINKGGATGAQGLTGAQGFQGVQGAQGLAGEFAGIGAQGVQGAQGTNGFSGAQGAVGPQGPQGVIGAQGVQGATGAQGVQGAQGLAGEFAGIGAQGVQGATGAQGNQGVQGASGSAGPTGVVAGTYGGSGNVAAFTVAANGLLLFATNSAISTSFNLVGNVGSDTFSTGDTLRIVGGNGITTTATDNTISVALTQNVNIFGSLTVGGNLYVEGNTTYLNTTTAVVEDALIKLANNNIADTVDIGFYGQYQNGAVKYAGLYRDASDNKFKLFTGLEVDPADPNLVSIPATGYTRGKLLADIEGGTISELINPVAVEDGGTGLSVFTLNGILYGLTTTTLGFATGTNGQVLQINDTGSPVFAVLDGGEY
jgi:hypothetical protein